MRCVVRALLWVRGLLEMSAVVRHVLSVKGLRVVKDRVGVGGTRRSRSSLHEVSDIRLPV